MMKRLAPLQEDQSTLNYNNLSWPIRASVRLVISFQFPLEFLLSQAALDVEREEDEGGPAAETFMDYVSTSL